MRRILASTALAPVLSSGPAFLASEVLVSNKPVHLLVAAVGEGVGNRA